MKFFLKLLQFSVVVSSTSVLRTFCETGYPLISQPHSTVWPHAQEYTDNKNWLINLVEKGDKIWVGGGREAIKFGKSWELGINYVQNTFYKTIKNIFFKKNTHVIWAWCNFSTHVYMNGSKSSSFLHHFPFFFNLKYLFYWINLDF